jgi:hypothetical protein
MLTQLAVVTLMLAGSPVTSTDEARALVAEARIAEAAPEVVQGKIATSTDEARGLAGAALVAAAPVAAPRFPIRVTSTDEARAIYAASPASPASAAAGRTGGDRREPQARTATAR